MCAMLKQLQHCVACPGKQELRNEADHHCCHCGQDGGQVEESFVFCLWLAVPHVHDHNHTQIVIGRDEGSEHTNNRKTGKATCNDGAEKVKLSDQSYRR